MYRQTNDTFKGTPIMNSNSYFCSTIGRKQLVGLTGLALCGFVLMHALTNMLILVSPDAYNKYSHTLVTNPLIYFAEAILVLLFLGHIVIAIGLTVSSKGARPEKYHAGASGVKAGSVVAKNMWKQGIIIAIFLVYHLITFKFGTYYKTTIDGVEMRDLHRLVVEMFQLPLYSGFYVFVMVVLFFHLSHGLSSSIQTFGFHHPKHTPKIEKLGLAFAALVAVCFVSQPLYCFFIYKG